MDMQAQRKVPGFPKWLSGAVRGLLLFGGFGLVVSVVYRQYPLLCSIHRVLRSFPGRML